MSCVAEEGIPTGQPGEKGLPVLLDSRPAVFIPLDIPLMHVLFWLRKTPTNADVMRL